MSENSHQASPNRMCNTCACGGGGLRTLELLGEGRSSTASHMYHSNTGRSMTMANQGGRRKLEMESWHTEIW